MDDIRQQLREQVMRELNEKCGHLERAIARLLVQTAKSCCG